MENVGKPVPHITPINAPFFEGARQGHLKLQVCQSCGEVIFYPRLVCPECLSRELEWEEVSGRGTIYTYTLVWRPAHPGFNDEVPIPLAVLELEEGPFVIANVVDAAPEELEIGRPVRAVFRQLDDAIVMPMFILSP